MIACFAGVCLFKTVLFVLIRNHPEVAALTEKTQRKQRSNEDTNVSGRLD